jgi:ribosome-associated protein
LAASKQSVTEAQIAFEAASEKLGENMVVLDVSEPFALADIFLIVSAKNERQVQAIAEFVEEKLSESGVKARMREGMEAARWVLLDFGNLVVHVMHEQEREFYSLERLWRDCPVVKLG